MTKVTALFLAIFLSTAAMAAHEQPKGKGPHAPQEKCELVEGTGKDGYFGGTLSKFWAQEVVGGPLTRVALERFAKEGGQVTPAPVGVIDSGLNKGGALGPMTDRMKQSLGELKEDGHGTNVVNLVNGTRNVGIGNGRLDAFVVHDSTTGFDSAGAMAKMNVRIVNISQKRQEDAGWFDKSVEDLAKRSIVVWANGNSGDHGVRLFPDAPGIIGVASMTPWGGISGFSQQGKGTDIYAPGEHPYVTSYDGKFRGFGGTSAAAPIVTGALSNVLSILPDLTAAEAKRLLARTAVPTAPTWLTPSPGGPGMVNALKLVEAAIRLKRRGWPADRAKLIEDPAIYDFAKTAPGESAVNITELLARGKELLRNPICSHRRDGLAKVQTAFLLSAGSPDAESRRVFAESAQVMADTLDAEGLTLNAAFYRALTPAGLAQVISRRIVAQTGEDRVEIWALSRVLASLPPASVNQLLLPLVQSPESRTAIAAVHVASDFRQVSPEVMRAAFANPSVEVRLLVVDRLTPGDAGRAILQQALLDPNEEVRRLAQYRLAGNGSRKG